MTSEQVEHAIDILSNICDKGLLKYGKGQREHGGNMWLKKGMLSNLEDELLDFIFYSGTLREQLETCLTVLKAGQTEAAILMLENILGKPQN